MKVKKWGYSEMKKELDIHPEYKILVEEAYRKKSNLNIPNTTLAHAIFLSKLLIDKAEKEIKIFTGKIEEIFYNNEWIRKAINNALKKKVKITIIVSDYEKVKNREFLKFAEKNNVQIMELRSSIQVDTHFLLSDGSAYRIERPHTSEDFAKEFRVEGIANFNDVNLGKQIDSAFSHLVSNSELR